MARIDKVKLKKEKNKIIHLDVARLDVKIDRKFSLDEKDWILPRKRKTGYNINIKSLLPDELFIENLFYLSN